MDTIQYGLFLMIAYLYGNILFAIPITRIITGKNIRDIGNTNPGTSNVFKNVGTLPGILVFLLDSSKALVPLIVAKSILFEGVIEDNHWFYLTLIGMAAIQGHTRPFWTKFKKGGGGMGTAIGLFLFMVPIEYMMAFVIGIILTYTFMKNANYKVGRWVTLYAAVLTPLFAWLTSLWVNVPLCSHISIGGHPLQVILSPILVTLQLFLLNSTELFFWIRKPKSKVNPR